LGTPGHIYKKVLEMESLFIGLPVGELGAWLVYRRLPETDEGGCGNGASNYGGALRGEPGARQY
jgi:hypothetical protein